jgi:hypothetical protein
VKVLVIEPISKIESALTDPRLRTVLLPFFTAPTATPMPDFAANIPSFSAFAKSSSRTAFKLATSIGQPPAHTLSAEAVSA